MPLRPGWGTLGREGQLRTNFFAVKLPKDAVYYDYEIAISPQAQAKGDRRARILELVEQSPALSEFKQYIAHDRSQRLVSSRQLPQPLSVAVRYLEVDQADDPNALTFTVDIKFQRELHMTTLNEYMDGKPDHRDIDTQPFLSALNLVMQSYASKRGVRVGGNKYFFPTSAEQHRLSLGVEAHRGFFMSIRPMYKQLMVNINVCMTAFYTPGNLAEAMIAFQQQTGSGMPQTFADRLKVTTRHLGYTKKSTIARIMTSMTARSYRFDCEEFKRKVSVEEYFKLKYKITLRHANDLPLINVSMNPKRPIYLPAEICEIMPGQAYRGKLDGEQTAMMIRYACNPPEFNGNAIVQQGFDQLGLRGGSGSQVLSAFGVSVADQMAVVPSRVLPAPRITYRSGAAPIRNAGWNIVNVKLHSGGAIANWAVLLVHEGRREEFRDTTDPELIVFLQTFLKKCSDSGIAGADKPPRILSVSLPSPRDDNNRERAIDAIRTTLRSNFKPNTKPSFILVLLSGIDRYIYPGIKKLCDIDMGIHTVHMLLPKARDGRGNRQDQYFSNVVLKVNAKLGGMNHLLDPPSMKWLTEKNTMIMGIDVTHPSPGSAPGSPSIAAVVASVDNNFVQFPASMTLQKPDWNKESKEMVEKLTEMTIERLQLYKKKNGNRLPDRIFVYRDGVSEGQYHLVLREELPKIQAAFKQISPKAPYKPTLTIAICGKRHHARFWPTAPGEANMTQNGNTVPGTVVDKGITDVYNNDFYLQAHYGLQGHVRPTHYTIVYDENRYSADVLQQGTHTASYLYARATKAVSLVPAAYYADLACERGRDYLNVLMNLSDDRSSVAGGPRTTADREAEKERVYENAVKMWGKGVHPDLKESMFYI
ncbi:Piwi-domain-containing protein [Pilatotrama ljubarskyi]|nr:Piwi-domain-containing protein [Pilatotrama ljubarskyi]